MNCAKCLELEKKLSLAVNVLRTIQLTKKIPKDAMVRSGTQAMVNQVLSQIEGQAQSSIQEKADRSQIDFSDPLDSIVSMSEGRPSAINLLKQLDKKYWIILDSLGIRGTGIARLYTDKCSQNLEILKDLLDKTAD